VTITMTCYLWTPSSGDYLFTCGAIFWPPHYTSGNHGSIWQIFVPHWKLQKLCRFR